MAAIKIIKLLSFWGNFETKQARLQVMATNHPVVSGLATDARDPSFTHFPSVRRRFGLDYLARALWD